MIVVPRQIVLIDEQVVIAIQLPELAVDDVKVFVAKVRHDLVDVLLLFEQLQDLSKSHNHGLNTDPYDL